MAPTPNNNNNNNNQEDLSTQIQKLAAQIKEHRPITDNKLKILDEKILTTTPHRCEAAAAAATAVEIEKLKESVSAVRKAVRRLDELFSENNATVLIANNEICMEAMRRLMVRVERLEANVYW